MSESVAWEPTWRVNIIDGGDGVTAVFEPASHVGSHATDSDKGDAFGTHRIFLGEMQGNVAVILKGKL